jgi:putative Holliday junction resolvase
MTSREDRDASGRGQTFEDITAFAAAIGDHGRLIGLDLGTKTIGVALSDVGRTVASGLETIRRRKFTLDAERLDALIAEHAAAGLVLGLPINLDGTEGPRAQSTRAFARNLNARLALPILLWDERLSTQAAERVLLEADQSRRRRAQVIDKMAATLILQGALDRMR